MVNIESLKAIITRSAFSQLPGVNSVSVTFPHSEDEIYFSSKENTRVQQLSASTIKIFILLVFYQLIETGISLKEKYLLKASDIVAGSGSLQVEKSGFEISYENLVRHMIVESDNSATNIIIDLIGKFSEEDAFSYINSKIGELGFQHSILNRKMMDLGNPQSNYTDTQDLAWALKRIYNHEYDFLEKYYGQIMNYFLECENREKIPMKLSEDISCYHKTGENEYKGVENDAAILKKNGESFILICLAQYFDPEFPDKNDLDENLEANPAQIKTQQEAIADLAHDLSKAYFNLSSFAD